MACGKGVTMEVKYLGALMVIISCGGFGFAMAAAHRAEERQLSQLCDVLVYLSSELQYRMTPLPELCVGAGNLGKGPVFRTFTDLGHILRERANPDVSACLQLALKKNDPVPSVHDLMVSLGSTLGMFDLSGQLEAIHLLRNRCSQVLDKLTLNREDRLRSYQTLGICAGAALVILLV